VELLRFPEDATAYHDRREEIRGPVHHILEQAVSRVMDELGTELVVLGTRRYELPRLPEVVLREAIANALAHRSYEAAGTAVRIELRPSLLVVRSPGGLPEPVTVENIREATAARNLVVIRILRHLGLAEDAGRGVDVMQDTMAAEMLDPPRFHDHGREVVVERRSAARSPPPNAPGSTSSSNAASSEAPTASPSCLPRAGDAHQQARARAHRG
jgi:ATP-dependent DNA helicase RecG